MAQRRVRAMAENGLWDFYQRELQSLENARKSAGETCVSIMFLLSAISEDDPSGGATFIEPFLDKSDEVHQTLSRSMSEIGHLIKPVAEPYYVPSGVQFPKLQQEKSAHHAVLAMDASFRRYFRWQATLNGRGNDDARSTDDLVAIRWRGIREKLQPVCEFDFRALCKAVVAESNAAIERCRFTLAFAASGRDYQSSLLRLTTNSTALANEPPGKGEGRRRKETKAERIRKQRNKFSRPRREKDPPETWPEIYDQYLAELRKNPSLLPDPTASPDTLRQTHDRNPESP